MNEIAQEQSASMSELIERNKNIQGMVDVSVNSPQRLSADAKPPSDNGNTSNGQNSPIMGEKTWERANARRCDLIRRKYDAGLTSAEEVELHTLEEIATNYLNTVAPLSDYPLNLLQAHIDRIKIKQQNDS